MAGLPGSGKSLLAADLARSRACAVLSADPVEAAMWRAGIGRAEPTGIAAYVVVEALAAEQLTLRHDVIVDAVNAVGAAREQWRRLAQQSATSLAFIEVRCSDEHEHRRRLESRQRGLEGFPEPSWELVQQLRRTSERWDDDCLVIDSMASRESNLRASLDYLGSLSGT